MTMRTEELPDFAGSAIFCDDIRQEIDQKASFIGVYNGGSMFVHGGFPLTLPRFGIALFFSQKRELFVPNIGIRIFLPGDSEENASIQGEAAPGRELSIADDMPLIKISAQMVFASLVIKQPGRIKVRALREGTLHRLGSLEIKSFPLPSNET